MEKTLLVIGMIALLGASVYMMNSEISVAQSNGFQQSEKIPTHVYDLYNEWKQKHNRKYASIEQEAYRLSVFYENYKIIMKSQEKADLTYTLKFTQFMDITNEEFKATYMGFIHKPREQTNEQSMMLGAQVPNAVDWRKDRVTPVKAQGTCGSCWAFSTTGALEALNYSKNNKLVSFSEQQLVDCSTQNSGCNGGQMDSAFTYVSKQGISLQTEYAYTGVAGACKKNSGSFKNTAFRDVDAGNCVALQQLLGFGPVSVGVDANNWQFHGSGVFNDCGTSLDHGVLAVGFDASGNWIIKNSWGTGWGESGYIRLSPGNTCGVCNAASYPY